MARIGSTTLLFAALLSAAAAGPCGSNAGALLDMVISYGEDCFAACSQVCGPAQQAIDAYLTGGEEGVTEVVCAAKEDFMCFVAPENARACGAVLAQAGSFGFKVPRTAVAFEARCGGASVNNDAEPSDGANTTTMAPTTGNATTTIDEVSGAAQTMVSAAVAAAALLAAATGFIQ